VRDLRKRDPQIEQSYSERQMYQSALERLAREFAAIEDIDQESAATKLEYMMDAA
jgi:CarD family transcriptional regulator